MADDADMRNELSDMQQRADQLADEVRAAPLKHTIIITTNICKGPGRSIQLNKFFK